MSAPIRLDDSHKELYTKIVNIFNNFSMMSIDFPFIYEDNYPYWKDKETFDYWTNDGTILAAIAVRIAQDNSDGH